VAGDLIQESGAVTLDAAPAATAEPKHARLYSKRFMVMYVLLGLALAATVFGVVKALDNTITPQKLWSAWKPSNDSSVGRTDEIASHTAQQYVLPSGDQMLDVFPKKLTVPLVDSSGGSQNVPIAGVVLRGKKGAGDTVAVLQPTDSRLYQLCGTGKECAIGEGKASVARGRLVRREALQLALLTFKYVPNVTHVIEFMPPPPGSQPSLVTYFEKNDLKTQLSEPLAATLSAKAPGVNSIKPAEATRIDNLTTGHVYTFTFRTTQLGDAVLLLTRAY
jgi:hypothetical protein